MGQLLLNLADPAGYNLFVLITVLVSLSFAPILLSTTPAPVHETTARMSIGELIRTSPLASFGNLLLGGIFAVLFGMAPIYATERGLTIAQVSYFISAIYLGGLLFQYPIGFLSDRFDRRYLIIAVTAIGALAAVLALFIGSSYFMLLVLALIIGGTSNPLYSLLLAYANDYLEFDQMAAASGGLLFINGCGAMTGPVVVGYVMERFGIHWFFITIAVLMSVICLYGIYRITQRTYDIAPEDVAPHVVVTSRITPMGTEIALEAADEAQSEAEDGSD